MGLVKRVEEIGAQKSPFKPFKFEKVGDSVTLLFMHVAEAVSPTYGSFEVVRGLRFDPGAATVDDALESAELISFPLQTNLANKISNGDIKPKEAYQITLAWKKGQQFDDGKVAKANGFNVKHLVLDESARNALIRRYNELTGEGAGGGFVKGEEEVGTPSSTPRF